MPSRAKLTTRGISTTTVTTDSLPKNLPLTNNELDSNFLNLRDQSFSIVGDDSTGIDIKAGDTIKFTGSGGATVTAVGDTITVTAGGGGGGSNLGNLQVNDTTLSPIVTNSDLILTANGTGDIQISTDSATLLYVGENKTDAFIVNPSIGIITFSTTSGTSNNPILQSSNGSYIQLFGASDGRNILLGHGRPTSTAGGEVQVGNTVGPGNITSYGAQDLKLYTNSGTNSGMITIEDGVDGNITIVPNGNGSIRLDSLEISETTLRPVNTNTDLILDANGTGKIKLDNNYWPNADGTAGQYLTTDGSGGLQWTTIASAATLGDFTFAGTTMSAGTTNADITITTTGTGNLNVDMDTLRLGDLDTNATITTNGTGDLILNTNSGTNSGSITIADGANGNIKILVNGTGKIDLVQELNATNFPFTPAVDNTNLAAYDSPTYVGSRQLYSNLTQGNITDPTERVRANTRFVAIKHPNDSTTYSDSDYVIQNTDITVVDINGQSFAQTSRGASARGEANNVFMLNTAGGTKTGPNMNGGGSFVEISEGHGGDLTCSNAMGFRSLISNRANTGEFTRMTNAYGFLSEGISTGGTGANGTNRFVTNEYGFFSQGATGTSLVTNYYGFYANTGANATNKYAFYSADDAYLSRLGTIERAREKQNALTSSSTITVNADLAPVHKVTLAENTQFGITGLSTGQTVTIIIVQDGVGNRTATFTSDTSTAVKFAGGTPALSTAANAIDVVKIYNDGTNFLGVIEKAFA